MVRNKGKAPFHVEQGDVKYKVGSIVMHYPGILSRKSFGDIRSSRVWVKKVFKSY
jgi:hypothetical protein